jgi:hypothetical protein
MQPQALRPPKPQLIALTNTNELVEAGLPWNSRGKAQWAFRKRNENGLAGAFVRIGRNIFVDPQKVHEVVRSQIAA